MSLNTLSYRLHNRRLALGLEFTDVLRQQAAVKPLRVEIETGQPHSSQASDKQFSFHQFGGKAPLGLVRSNSGRYSLSYFANIREFVDLRIYDLQRFYIPRRIRVPLMTLADVEANEAAEVVDYFSQRVRKVAVFPAANYHGHSHMTGLRGRVTRDGEAMRWAIVEARIAGEEEVLVRARGDDRGEFLLILPPHAVTSSELSASVAIDVAISGPATAPVPTGPQHAQQDIFWDLPLELIPALGDSDNVSDGSELPGGHITPAATQQTIHFPVGKILTGREVNDFTFLTG